MDSYKIIYSSEAKNDLKSVFSYIAFELKERQTAIDQTNRIREAVRALEILPNRNPAVDFEPWLSRGMRKLVVDNFLAFYIVDAIDREVQIVRIFYGGRDIKTILQ